MGRIFLSPLRRFTAAFVLVFVGLLVLASAKKDKAPPIDPTAYDALVSNRVTSAAHLLNWFAEQQDHFERLIPPGIEVLNQPGTPDVLVIDLDSEDLPSEFAKYLLGTTPVFRYSVPTYDVFVQETAEGTIDVRDGDGNVLYADPAPSGYAIPYEALFRQSQYPHHYIPELARYRLNARVTLLPLAYVEHYLFAKQQIEEAASLFEEEEPPLMMMMSGSGDDVWISAMTRMTNGLRLSLDYTESYSGQVWSAYSYDARYCPITNSVGGSGGGSPPVPGTNDPPACTNCPISDCDIDVTNSFLGLERVWSLTYSNLLLTGATRTVWLDTRPMGLDAQTNPTHRFYGFGSNVDTDGDGLNDGHELFISHTDRENADTDGDGLPDGWEVQNGLNPLSSAGADGASGDPDGDGLSNAEELQAQSSPQQANAVVDVAATGASIDARSIHLSQIKCGFPEYTNVSSPPKIYLVERQFDWDYCDIDLCAQVQLSISNTTHEVCNPQSGIFTGTTLYVHTRVPNSEPLQCSNEVSTVDWVDFGIALTCESWWDQCLITNTSVYKFSDDSAATSNGVTLDCAGWHVGVPYRVEQLQTRSLENEYTTASLLSYAASNLDQWSVWTNLSWGQQRQVSMPGYAVSTNPVEVYASRDLSANETNIALRKLQYRLKVLDATAAVYRIRWMEIFTPEGGGTSQVLATRSAVVRGTGAMQYLYTTNYLIAPPTSDGQIAPVVIGIEMTRPDEKSMSRYFHEEFDGVATGVCKVTCIIGVVPNTPEVRAHFQGRIRWSIEAVTGSTRSWENGGAGPGVGVYDASFYDWREKAVFTALPANNASFGEKKVTATIDGLNGVFAGKTKIFFDRDAKNHPGTGTGTTPNWYFYWQQGAVGGGLDDFVYAGTHSSIRGRYDPTTDTLYIYGSAPEAKTTTAVQHKTNTNLSFNIGIDAEGIDAVAGTVIHEKKHKWVSDNWSTLPDTDGDDVPDSEEGIAPYYFAINDPDTYNLASTIDSSYASYGDQEFLCRQEEPGFVSDETKDWANPGKQWTDGTTDY